MTDDPRQDIALVERVAGQRLTRIMGPCLDDPGLMSQTLVYRPRPMLEAKAVEFYETQREGPPERLSLDGVAWRSLVDVCRRLERAHERLGERATADAP